MWQLAWPLWSPGYPYLCPTPPCQLWFQSTLSQCWDSSSKRACISDGLCPSSKRRSTLCRLASLNRGILQAGTLLSSTVMAAGLGTWQKRCASAALYAYSTDYTRVVVHHTCGTQKRCASALLYAHSTNYTRVVVHHMRGTRVLHTFHTRVTHFTACRTRVFKLPLVGTVGRGKEKEW